MNVLADFHHHDLYYSLQLLFEKRLGWNLYRPIGVEWHDQGYWTYAHQADTVKQFLGLDQTFIPSDGTPALNQIDREENGIYYIRDTVHDSIEKAITLEKFSSMQFDIVIASVPDHFTAFDKLVKERNPNAKLICHFGNILWNIADYPYKNIMASIAPQPVPDNYNVVFYHQEFDLNVYSYQPPKEGEKYKSVRSFVNCLPNIFTEDYKVYNQLKELLPDFEFKSYGGSCDNGSLGVDRQIAREMQTAGFGFHCKTNGDGYGHVIHNWFAVGKPVITRGSDYVGKLAGDLLEDGKTCFDIERHSLEEIADTIKNMSNYRYKQMCENVRTRFELMVDFDDEFEEIKEFLDKLQ